MGVDRQIKLEQILARLQQAAGGKLVDLQGGAHHLLDAGVELLAEALGVQVPEDKPREDGGNGGVLEVVNVERVEVAHEPRRHLVLLPHGRLHGSDDERVDEAHGKELLAVIPNFVVHHLSQQLQGPLKKTEHF